MTMQIAGRETSYRTPPGPERKRIEQQQRRCICAVMVRLRCASEAQIIERCRRFYGLDPADVSEQLLVMVEHGVIRGIDSADEQQLWELDWEGRTTR